MPSNARLIDADRIWADLMTLSEIGALGNGGCCRLSLTDEDRIARDLFCSWCRDAGLAVRVDDFGNVFATRKSRDPTAPHILVGSHLDTQPHGGRFDGALGVVAGLEVLRAFDRHGIDTECPVTLVNWTNEEGVRFSPGLTGSSGFVGVLDRAARANIRDGDGFSFEGELERIGYLGAPFTLEVSAYYELHIEQGPILEGAGVPVGLVEGVQGVRWIRLDLTGEDRHAGTTPVRDRKDAFMTAARLAVALRETALLMDETIRITFGRIIVDPNSTNTVPGGASLTIDLRHRETTVLDSMESEIRAAMKAIGESEGVVGKVDRIMDVSPVRFDPALLGGLERAALKLDIRPLHLSSGAMHDASSMARLAPTAMIFVPSHQGISHNEREWTEPVDVAIGCEVLARAIEAHACGGMARCPG